MRLLLTLNVGKQNKGMYSTITLAKKYIQYYFKASNGKGHGVHSPFVYLFIKEVLNKNKSTELFSPIEVLRNELLHNKKIVQVWDRGAGSRQTENNNRAICQIAKAALKPKKYSALLHHIVAYFKPANVLEMGTSLGITTSYLAVANPLVAVVTMEGAPTIAELARENFNKLGIQIELKGDIMWIHGGTGIQANTVFSQHDHRIAMACSIAALNSNGPVEITDAEAVNKSYTDFFEHLACQ